MSTEIIADADHKMARAVEAMERDFQGIRTGRASTALVERIHVEYYGTSDAAQPAGRDQRPGAAPDRHPAVGPRRPRRDREGHHQERHRPDAERRRHRRPAQHPAADRGASQGPRPSRPQAHGGGQGRDPQPAPRRRRRAQEGRARRRRSGPTRRTASSRPSSGRPTGTSPTSTASAPARNRRSSRSSGPSTSWPGRPTRRPRRMTSRPTPRPASPGRARGRDPFFPPDELPRHVAIIMDGNRRWARQRDLPELEGHAAGVEAIREPPPPRRPARRPGPDAVRVQPRELGADRRGGHRPVRPPRGGHPQRDRGAARAGRPDPAARPARGAARRDPSVDRRGARARPPTATGCS